MADFTFEGPGGKTITITGPEGATREQAIDILRQHRPELWNASPEPGEPTLRSWGQLLHETPEGPRFQLWPERLARGVGRDIGNLVETFPEVASGRIDINTPEGIRQAVSRTTPGLMDVLPGAPGAAITTKVARQAAAPTMQALEKAAKAGYEQVKTSGALLNPLGLDAVHDAIATALEGENWYGDINAPNTFKLLGKLKGREGPQSFGEVQKIRESLNKVGGTDEDKAAANYAKRLIDDYLTQVPAQHVISGDPVADAATLREAGANYRGAKRTEALTGNQIGAAVERAERQAGKGGTGWNLGNTLRQRIDAVLNSENERRYFTDEEQQALRKVVTGSWLQNRLRELGKAGPRAGSLTRYPYVAAAGHALLGGGMDKATWTALAVGILTEAAHHAENAVTKSAINKVAERIRADTPLGRSMPTPPPYDPLLAQMGMYGAVDALLQPPNDSLR